MTKREIFIEKDLFFNLLMWVEDWDGRIPIPSLLIPTPGIAGSYTPLWTGKQAFNLICPKGINMTKTSKAHLREEKWESVASKCSAVLYKLIV